MAGQSGKRRRGKKQPITRHPLFPAVIALWCGALFGLGALAIRPTLLESLVLSSHIDTIFPLAAPPLGIRARILLALALAAAAGIAGSTIARRIARPKVKAHKRRRDAAAVAEADVRRPISAHDELGEQIASAPLGGRRRALAMEEDNGPNYAHEFVPLPGGSPQILGAGTDHPEPASAPEACELGGLAPAEPAVAAVKPLALETQPAARPFAQPAMPAMPEPIAHEPASQAPRHFAQPVAAAAARQAAEQQDESSALRPFAQPAAFAPSVPAAPAAIETPAIPQPMPIGRLPGLGEAFAGGALPTAPVATPMAATQPSEPPLPLTAFAPPSGSAAERIAAAELGALSHVELIERLAISLQRRRGVAAAAAVKAPAAQSFAPAPASVAHESSAQSSASDVNGAVLQPPPANDASPAASSSTTSSIAMEAESSTAAENLVVPPPLKMPAALRPIALDFDDGLDDDDALLSAIPPRHIAMTTPAPADPPAAAQTVPQVEPAAPQLDDAEVETEVPEDSYSSLLDLTAPLPQKQAFVRVEEPEESAAVEPVVVFPGQGPARPFAAPAPAAAQPVAPAAAPPASPANPGLRRFDAPGAAPAAGHTPAVNDPAETEQALRTALAALQRMSGTA